ncbi:uncharacterized protein LOC143861982 isoform X2 [Tasmannia lanceolata]|uniref:uncharacterized protein LOC143861982 isoform X2 n=1 Tax=Tasmannia lanceolata TaxID=3420 RepID=UPI00406354CA
MNSRRTLGRYFFWGSSSLRKKGFCSAKEKKKKKKKPCFHLSISVTVTPLPKKKEKKRGKRRDLKGPIEMRVTVAKNQDKVKSNKFRRFKFYFVVALLLTVLTLEVMSEKTLIHHIKRLRKLVKI